MTDVPRLGALEEHVMEVLWDHGPATVREIIGYLPGEPAYTTIATVLNNLRKKDLVGTRKDGRATYYRALGDREDRAAQLMGHVLDSSRDRAGSILRFVGGMNAEDLALLRGYLEAHPAEGTPDTGDHDGREGS